MEKHKNRSIFLNIGKTALWFHLGASVNGGLKICTAGECGSSENRNSFGNHPSARFLQSWGPAPDTCHCQVASEERGECAGTHGRAPDSSPGHSPEPASEPLCRVMLSSWNQGRRKG